MLLKVNSGIRYEQGDNDKQQCKVIIKIINSIALEEITEYKCQEDYSGSVPAGKGRSIDPADEVMIIFFIRAAFKIECPDNDYDYESENESEQKVE